MLFESHELPRKFHAADESDKVQGSPADEASDGIELPADSLIVLPTRGMVLFPGVVLPLAVSRDRSVRALQAAVQGDLPIGVILQRDPDDDAPEPAEMHTVGTRGEILRYITTPDGEHHAIVQGQERFVVREFTQLDPYPVARVEFIAEPNDQLADEEKARFLTLKQQAREALSLLPQAPEGLNSTVQATKSATLLADMIATFIDMPAEEKQSVLETLPLIPRLIKVSDQLERTIQVLKLSREMREKAKGNVDRAQREYLLREQLKAIKKELGEGPSSDVLEIEERLEEAGLSPEAEKEARKELSRLEMLPEASAEYGTVRTYLDWIVDLPWKRSREDAIDISRAREILDEDHYGLEKVKKRILEFLAVRKLNPKGKGPILCLVGPPGVGKTSLGKSVARALGRKFVRISLGGTHDEAEIRGHRRTYVGSMPGRILQQLRKVGVNNPVFMLDEMDKLGQSFHGDPSAALLEVLDPEQNDEFRDNYLGVPFDLSNVMFISTANVLDAIPGPLRDRMEVIELPGYTMEEKLQIARRYLVGRQLQDNGLTAEQFEITDEALAEIAHHYTREAGVRNLERQIGAVVRHVATRIAADEIATATVDAAKVNDVLGPRRYESELALRTSVPGVATGLAWTPVGGEILFVEASKMPGNGQLVLTGQLGDVMKESARAAISLIKANATELGIDSDALQKSDVHVHVPAGAIPKDGPSAGVAIYSALVSLLTARTIRSDVAMTGEISLRGLVLPVGGIKEKALAAAAAGIKTVLLPARNKKDLPDIPESAQSKLEFVWVEKVSQALESALEQPAMR